MHELPSDPGTTSLSLLERARGRETDAWQRLVDLYGPLVFAWARRSGLNETDAADLAQEVWQAVAAALARFQRDEHSGTFRGWLWTIARNKVHDLFRARCTQPQAPGGTDARRVLEAFPDQEPEDPTGVQENQLLHRALEMIRLEFEERTWKAFWRMAVDDQAAADVGHELGMAANAVHQAKFRVLRRLRQEMAGLVDA